MCKRNGFMGALLVGLLLLGVGVAHAGSDVFSVNFYYKPWPWPDTDTQHITLEDGNQSAGVGDWLTDGWQDIEIPWAPPGPQDPVPITSNKGATATFTLVAARNGGSYSWDQVRTTLLGDGNGDMMDGHANGTEQEDELIEMTVSDIPFNNYDVILYMGSQSAQFFDGTGKIVFNGDERDFTLISGAFDGTFVEIVDATTPGNFIVYEGQRNSSFTVQVWGNGFNHIGPCGFQFREIRPELARGPSPEEEATDVLRDTMLTWTPGDYAATHDVYLGTVFDDVNDATRDNPLGVLVSQGQTAGAYDPPEVLEFSQTYYWRVDEVNGAPDNTIFKGEIWSFTVEPVAYPIEAVTAKSNTTSAEDAGPENAVNGSGLDENDRHSTETTEMWVGTPIPGEAPYIQFEFDGVYKLHEMLVWNYNMSFETFLGMGVKDATVEYSQDGIDWVVLGDVVLNQAPGEATYRANTTVSLEGVAAQYVRLNIHSSWISTSMHALSEVRFMYIPVHAKEPQPADGALDVPLDTMLEWQSGREAVSHEVYLGTDPDALDLAAITTEPSYAATLGLASTYYWQVAEVNDAEAISTWAGDIWSFSTQEYILVDGFESYTDNLQGGEAIFQTWVDGIDDASKGGSIVGYEQSPFAEQTIVHGGGQSMPLTYDNTVAAYSETMRTFDVAQNWTLHGIEVLTLWVYGNPDNDAQEMYIKINDTKVPYNGEAPIMSERRWRQWDITLEELANQGLNLQSVTQLGIGFDRIGAVGGQGRVFIDDIQLSRPAAEESPSISIPVPNGDFETLYKPGTAITGFVAVGAWSMGVGPDCPIDGGSGYEFSDGTTGANADIPGWIGYDMDGWVAGGGTYDRDITNGNFQGNISFVDENHMFGVNGGGWGNPAGGLIVSDASLATVEDGLTYTLSMRVRAPEGAATPIVLDLLANGAVLTPTSSVDPVLTGQWQEISRTYDAASLAEVAGQDLTIVLGVDRGSTGGQSHFDDVSLSYIEPGVSLVENFDSLAVGATMHDVDGWEGWFGDAQWGARVTDVVAYSGTNCLEIVGERDDLVPNWPAQSSGQWILKVMQYCPSNVATAGKMYFGALSEYDGAAETVGWVGSLIADFGTGKAYCEEDQAVQVDLVYDTWVELRVEIDLDSQMAYFYYNNVYLTMRPAASIAGVDIWPTAEIESVYFDDFSFEQAP